MVTAFAIAAGADVERGVEHAVRLAGQGLDATELSRALYHHWYLGGMHCDAPQDDLPPMIESLAGSFRAAHAGSRYYERGWSVVDVGRDGTSVVRRAQRHRVVRPSSMIAAGGLLPRRGDDVAVRRVVDDVPTEGGFWHTFSDRVPLDMDAQLSRVYWNTTPSSAVALVAELTELLIDTDIGWQLKCLTTPQLYARPDSAVLYLEHQALCAIAAPLGEVHRSLASGLGSSTPPLARRLGHGAAWAAQPTGGDSFGEHRCTLLARAAIEAADPSGVADSFDQQLRMAGIDPAAPHRPYDLKEPSWPPH